MDLIENNPFRILGLPLTATVREIDKRANDLETFASMGKTKAFDTDFLNFAPVVRTLENVTEAKKKLQLAEEKFRHSLFWFWKNNSVDELALDLLRDGDIEKAKTIWEKAVFANSEDVYIPVAVIEDLISETKWSTTDNDDWRTEKEDGYFVIEKRKVGAMQLSQKAEFEDTEKWLIECDCEWMSGAENSPFGVVFGGEGNNFFTFNISANGFYSLFRYVDRELEKLIDWTDSDVIDGYGINHLEIQRNVDEIILRINHEEVERIERDPFFGQHFGFYVNNIQTVHFSNLRLSKIERDGRYASGVSVSNKNISCVKNLSLLQLYHSAPHGVLKSFSWEPSISLFGKFISSEYFDEYAKSVAGEKFVLNKDETIDYYNRLLAETLKPRLGRTYGVTTTEFISSFSIFPDKNYQSIKNLFVAGTIREIDKAVDIAERQRSASAIKAVESGNTLISSVESELERLSNTLGTDSIEYQLETDKVVSELVRSAIDHSHQIFEPEMALPLLKFASQIAVTPNSMEFVNRILQSCETSIPEKHIVALIEEYRNLIALNPKNAVSYGQKLITESEVHLATLEEVSGADSEEYIRCADAVSNLLVQCGIVHFNATKNDEPALPLYRYAVALAESPEAEKYADENLASCKKWIEDKDYMLCYFCGKNPPEKDTSVTKTMYMETSRERQFNNTRVGYSYGDVLIPRCGICQSLHQATSSYYTKFTASVLGGLAAGFVGGVLIYPHFRMPF
jgi:hypothetical protein